MNNSILMVHVRIHALTPWHPSKKEEEQLKIAAVPFPKGYDGTFSEEPTQFIAVDLPEAPDEILQTLSASENITATNLHTISSALSWRANLENGLPLGHLVSAVRRAVIYQAERNNRNPPHQGPPPLLFIVDSNKTGLIMDEIVLDNISPEALAKRLNFYND